MKKLLSALVLSTIALTGFSRGDLDNQFYLRGGIARPTWHYMFAEGKDDFEDNNGDAPKRGGFAFEMGNIFMLNSLDFADGMRFGINADYLSIYNANFKDRDTKYKTNTFFFGSKVGPSFTYSPVDNLELDVFAKLHPVWVALSTSRSNDETIFDSMSDDGFLLSVAKLKYSLGFNVRYSVAMLGFDYCPGRMITYAHDSDGEKSDDALQNEDKDNPRYSTFSITVGVSF